MENTNILSEKEVARAVSNDPALSDRAFVLGDREFKIVDLDYDSYVTFIAYLQPLAEAIFGGFLSAQMGGDYSDTINVAPSAILKYCRSSLPEMACIVCRKTDENITVEEVKRLAKTPFALAAVVLKQIEQNNMIKDFADFFGSMVPLMKKAMAGQALSTTKETP